MAQTKQKEVGIKIDGIKVVQLNYLEKKTAREKAEELAERNSNAIEYSLDCEHRRKQELKDKVLAIVAGIVGASLIFAMVACSNTEPRYAIPFENGNGIHYTYVTERKCEVTEVTDTQVYVSYKGNEYAFYAYNTELEVGDKVICKFTDNWEIIDTK
jgi:hypothetical protein